MSYELPHLDPDPRDPGNPLVYKYLDNTTFQTFMHCPRHYFYSSVIGLRPGGPKGPIPSGDEHNVNLVFGSLIHEGADVYNKLVAAGVPTEEATIQTLGYVLNASWPEDQEKDVFGGRYVEVFQCPDRTKTVTKKGIKRCEWAKAEHLIENVTYVDGKPTCACGREVKPRIAYVCPENYKNRRNLARAMVALCDYFSASSNKVLVLPDGRIGSEFRWFQPLQVKSSDGSWVTMTGSFDRVSQDGVGNIFIDEYKTTKRQPNEAFWTGYEMSPQIHTYSWAAAKEFGVGTTARVIAIHIGVNFVEIYAKTVPFGLASLDEWQNELEHYVQESQVRAGLALTHVQKGIDPIEAYPRRLSACNGLPGASTTPCPFRDFCRLSPIDRMGFIENNFHQEPWNPLGSKATTIEEADPE